MLLRPILRLAGDVWREGYFLLLLERGVPLDDADEVVPRADVMERVKKLAESATVDDLMDHLYVVYKVRRALVEAAAGNKVSQDEARGYRPSHSGKRGRA